MRSGCNKKPRLGLSSFEQRFCELVATAKSPNATQALRDMGWKGTRPDVKASKLLQRPHVKERIAQIESDVLAAAQISRVQIVREMGRVAFADIRKLYDESGNLKPIHELDEEAAAQLAGVEVEELFEGRGEDRQQIGVLRKVKRWDKVKALADLADIAGIRRKEPATPQSVFNIQINL
jgi:phage terminase small subunit